MLLFIRLLSQNSKARKYFNVGQFILCMVVLGVIIFVCFSLIGKKIYRNGVGELFTDYAEIRVETGGTKESEPEAGIGDTLIITVSLDKIHIGEDTYSDVTSAQQMIADAVTSGKELRIIDDYALAATYNDLIDVITQMNVSRQSIEEIKQP